VKLGRLTLNGAVHTLLGELQNTEPYTKCQRTPQLLLRISLCFRIWKTLQQTVKMANFGRFSLFLYGEKAQCFSHDMCKGPGGGRFGFVLWRESGRLGPLYHVGHSHPGI
jgi:hypothetical protein